MSHLTLFQGLLLNLKQQIKPSRRRDYLTREQAYELLKHHTGQDFGNDVDRWSKWIKEHPTSIRVEIVSKKGSVPSPK